MRRTWPRRPRRQPPWCRHNKCTERTSASRLRYLFVFYSSAVGDASAIPVSYILSSQWPALSTLLVHSLLMLFLFLFHPPCAHFTSAVPPFNFSPHLSSPSPPSPVSFFLPIRSLVSLSPSPISHTPTSTIPLVSGYQTVISSLFYLSPDLPLHK